MTISQTFLEVSITGTKSGKCAKCGKRAKRTEKFWQTLNPFNKNPDGTVRSRTEIMQLLFDERAAWLKEPVYHAKCQPSYWATVEATK